MHSKIIGKDIPRLESTQKANGSGAYTDDFSLPGMVYGAVLRSPYPNARVLSIDTKAVEEFPGVLTVLLPDDVTDVRYNSSGNPPSPLLQMDEQLLTKHPLYEGDAIAAVAAESPEICRQALQLFSVTYEQQEAILDIDTALTAPPLHPEISPSNDFCLLRFEKGDVEVGLAACNIVLEDTFFLPAVQPFALEPTTCICSWKQDGITIYSNSQTLFQERRILASMFALPESAIRIVKPLMGGGFGARQQLHYQPIACLLSKKLGKPVKMTLTREEENLATTTRHAAKIHMRLGANRDGTITVLDIESWHDTGAYCTHGPIVLSAQGKKTQYAVEHYRYRGHCVYTNHVPAGAMRGYGNPQVSVARELLIDRLAQMLERNPVDLRLQNHLETGEHIPGTETKITSCEIRSCAEKALAFQKQVDEAHTTQGQWGVSFCMHTSGPSNKSGLSSASIYVNPDGSIQLNLGTADIGQGSETAMAQVAAEVLGIPLSAVRVHAADTQSAPYDTGTFGSSQMFVGGNAVVKAAESAIEHLRLTLARQKKLDHTAVLFSDGRFFFPQEESLSFAEAVHFSFYHDAGTVIFGEASYKATEAPPVFSVCMVRCEENIASGSICITDLIQTVDAGKVINQNIVKGQIEGGMIQGLGYGWMEEVETDKRTGKHITADALLYKIPTAMDVPNLHTAAVDGYDPHGPLGAKSVGELTLVPVAPALAICVERMTGKQIHRLPLSRLVSLTAKREE